MKRTSHSKRSMWIFSIIVVAALLMAACQPAEAPAQPTIMPTAAPTAAATEAVAPAATAAPDAGAVVEEPVVAAAAHPEFGQILVDSKGMTLYMFTKDTTDTSNCEGGCLAAWPPLLTNGSPVAGEGVDESLLGVGTMKDGRQIVTYNKMPLYYWQNDKQPGNATGQDVNQVWYVVNPAGEIVREAVSVPATGGEGSVPSGEATVTVFAHPELGQVLADSKGMVLYMFTKDEPNKVNCAGGCLEAWPPLIVESDPIAGDGVDQSLLGTADMPDGRKIVTYNQMPLYYWAADVRPGDATGQDVNNVWYVVNPEGEPVGMQ